MPIEAATFISTLNASNPPSTDLLAEGDDHLRLLKSVLLASFPNIAGAMTASHTVLNAIDGRATSLETSVGLLDNGASVVPVSGVLEQAQPVNAQTGLNYTYLLTDRGKLVTRTNAAAMGDTLPQATGSFGAGWFMLVKNIHATSLLTITPTTSTIDGAATLVVRPGTTAMISSDGTNYASVVVSADPWRYLARTSAYVVQPTDCRPPTILNFTTAGVTLSTNVAASNFAGCLFVVQNSAASGDITFDPNSTETIDGSTTLIIHPGQTFFIYGDGVNFRSVSNNVLLRSSAIATLSTTYNVTTADRGKSLRFAGLSADVNCNLPSAASCGNGFILFVSNEDTNDTVGYGVIVEPNGAELIDGVTNRKMYTGSRVTLQSDGVGWRTVHGNWRYFSGNQTIAAAALLTLPHGLGIRPKHMWMDIVCTTADAGFSIGDIYPFGFLACDGVTVYNHSVVPDATNLNIRQPSVAVWPISNKTTGAYAAMTTASWRARYYAED